MGFYNPNNGNWVEFATFEVGHEIEAMASCNYLNGGLGLPLATPGEKNE